MESYCNAECNKCMYKSSCKGCVSSCGKPFSKSCIAASYIKVGEIEQFEKFKEKIIDEFNDLQIEGMPKLTSLNMLCGKFVNMPFRLPGGQTVKILDDDEIYLGNQLILDSGDGLHLCFGLVAHTDFLLVCQYGENGENPEIVMFKRR